MLRSEDEAERMTGRVEEDAKGRAWLHVRFTCAHREYLLLGRIEIVDLEVEVGLLWVFATRPHRWIMVGCELEGERSAAVAV